MGKITKIIDTAKRGYGKTKRAFGAGKGNTLADIRDKRLRVETRATTSGSKKVSKTKAMYDKNIQNLDARASKIKRNRALAVTGALGVSATASVLKDRKKTASLLDGTFRGVEKVKGALGLTPSSRLGGANGLKAIRKGMKANNFDLSVIDKKISNIRRNRIIAGTAAVGIPAVGYGEYKNRPNMEGFNTIRHNPNLMLLEPKARNLAIADMQKDPSIRITSGTLAKYR